MAEIIDINELRRLRSGSRSRREEQEALRRAVALMRENLISAAEQLEIAPVEEHYELLRRIEKLAAMIRYGMRMLGENFNAPIDAAG